MRSGANSAASVPVSQAWLSSRTSASNSAARRLGVEMGGDLVEQQQRRLAAHRLLQPRMGQQDRDQQRLLLAGRGEFGGDPCLRQADGEIGAVRADRGAAGLPRRCAGLRRAPLQTWLRRPAPASSSSQPSTVPTRVSRARGNGPSASAQARSSRCDSLAPAAATATPCAAMTSSSAASQAGSAGPSRNRRDALAQRLLIARDARGMRRIEPEHQPIEKPAPAAGPVDEQPIHRRRQPDDAEPLAECRLAARRLAVDPDDAALAVAAGSRPVPIRNRTAAASSTIAATAQPRIGRDRCRRPRSAVDLGRARRRAARGPAPETRAPPADWSCRRRWGRSAPPVGVESRAGPRGSCGNR